jgi:hypothetical protein
VKTVSIILMLVIWLSVCIDKDQWQSLSKEQQMNLITGLKSTYCASEDDCDVDVIIRKEKGKVTIILTKMKEEA